MSYSPPLIRFHQWLLHSLGRGKSLFYLRRNELNTTEEKYSIHCARKYWGYVTWKLFLLQPIRFARNN